MNTEYTWEVPFNFSVSRESRDFVTSSPKHLVPDIGLFTNVEFQVVSEELFSKGDELKSLSPNKTTRKFKFCLFIKPPRELKELIFITTKHIIS